MPKHAHAKLSTFTSQGLANTCWALATLGVGSAEDLTPFAREIEARADEFKPQVRLYPLVMFIILSVSATARRRLTDSSEAVGFHGGNIDLPVDRTVGARRQVTIHRPRTPFDSRANEALLSPARPD